MHIAKLYKQVTTARVDAMVPELEWLDQSNVWWHKGRKVEPETALSLIGWHWLGLLGNHLTVAHAAFCGGPIEALAAYLIATAKEPVRPPATFTISSRTGRDQGN